MIFNVVVSTLELLFGLAVILGLIVACGVTFALGWAVFSWLVL